MNPLIGDVGCPVEQVIILVGKAGEDVRLERVVLGVLHDVFALPLVTRRVGLRREEGSTVTLSERLQLATDLGVVPIGPRDGRFQIVDTSVLGTPPN